MVDKQEIMKLLQVDLDQNIELLREISNPVVRKDTKENIKALMEAIRVINTLK